MREAFERWAVVEGLPVNKGSKKEYLNVKTRLAWRAWKAGVQTVMNKGRFMGKWIKCSERMPYEGQEVIVMDVNCNRVQSGMVYVHGGFVDFNEEYYEVHNPSHWMPLPEPPEV